MKPSSAAHAVFATPELALSLFAYLTPHDLTRCIRVCKQWLCQAEPVLWSDFAPGEYYCYSSPPITTAGLDRNKPYIRTVELTVQSRTVIEGLAHGAPRNLEPDDCDAVSSTPCTNLKQLRIEDWHAAHDPLELEDNIGPLVPSIVTLLNYNHRLTHLTLPFQRVKIDDSVLAAISNLKQLQYLAVNNPEKWVIKPRRLARFLQAFLPLPELTELHINAEVLRASLTKVEDMEDYELEAIIKEAAIARSSQTPKPGKIKALQLPFWLDVKGNPVALPLLTLGLLDLESCTIFSFTEHSQPRDIEQMVREYCPNLKHLKFPLSGRVSESCQIAGAFIRGCSGIRSFVSRGLRQDSHNDLNGSIELRHLMLDLISQHHDTLEELELESCVNVFSFDQQKILSQCQQLKRYYVMASALKGDAAFNSQDDLTDWVCSQLRELRISLGRHSIVYANHFYKQIGQLEKLERLTFDVDRCRISTYGRCSVAISGAWNHTRDLTVSKGWLGELAGLKRLWSLSLEADSSRGMGQAEVEFMHEHWPQLSEINIVGKDIWQVRTQAHWQWLCDKRPYLRFTQQNV
ncbi:hypothetical protein BGZ72_010289, partial [Mortierella alpina]